MTDSSTVHSSSKLSISSMQQKLQVVEQYPRGLENVGNTCYANAALQCLLSTALTNALLDPKVVRIFRRYSSNPNLLAKGSGSVDSKEQEIDEEEDEITTVDQEKLDDFFLDEIVKSIQKEEIKPVSEKDIQAEKEREKKQMQENCDWLTSELTHLAQEYTIPDDSEMSVSTKHSSMFSSWFGPAESIHGTINPGRITRYPNRLSKCLLPYQQEDAHEFLRSLLSTLAMNGQNRQLSSLFDGLLESAVICQRCGNQSLTRDRYMDLSLDINDPDTSTLEDALYQFTKAESLEHDNAVFCMKCNVKRPVTKCLRLATAPSILVCHLKRFAINRFGQPLRLNKRITFPKRLEISDYMSQLNKATPPPYDLVGILVHQGQTCDSGHYLSYVKRLGQWYRCNDNVVTQVDEETALDQQAYILVYEVAEMKAKVCGTPTVKKKKRKSKSRRDRNSSSMGNSQDGVWSLLFSSDKHWEVLTEFCCAAESGFSEPKTTYVRHRTKRRNSASSADSTILQNDLQVIEIDRKKGGRSSTAPRQRDAFGGQSSSSRSNAVSPTRSDTYTPSSRGSSRSKKKSSRQQQSNLVVSKELPPLPNRGRRRRAKSNGAIRFKGGYNV
ncbi:unnamed protein product [Cylindrotheca closterium]|uniref:Ubiquitin carboxyl-terminal hydrolase n=1 Tax=Cylindrotheca closterium TaxID=2856 RepID=A0AAD2FSD1_9STRA|nr:unnamed protein product [Cylindrotheca closterium]